jgi:hypothetical protein
MARKKLPVEQKVNDVLLLPAGQDDMRKFIIKYKTYLTEQAVSSIEFAVENDLPFVEVFKFNDSDFIITISKQDYLANINHIYRYYLDTEKYELCPRIVKLQSLLENIKPNEQKPNSEE